MSYKIYCRDRILSLKLFSGQLCAESMGIAAMCHYAIVPLAAVVVVPVHISVHLLVLQKVHDNVVVEKLRKKQ